MKSGIRIIRAIYPERELGIADLLGPEGKPLLDAYEAREREALIAYAKGSIARVIAEAQTKLTRTGVVCEHCGNLGASAEDEAIHNTGECHCASSRGLCWREWWGECQPT